MLIICRLHVKYSFGVFPTVLLDWKPGWRAISLPSHRGQNMGEESGKLHAWVQSVDGKHCWSWSVDMACFKYAQGGQEIGGSPTLPN